MPLLLAIAIVASTPTPPHPTRDTTVGLYYSGQPAAAVSLVGSAAHTITLATWRLTDGTLCAALAHAASNEIAVQVAYNGTAGTSDAQWIATRGIVASGGTVYACEFPHKIANNFFQADGDYTLMGNYYYSPTAVQIGAYSIAVSGTPSATQAATTFATLIASGTITMSADVTPPKLRLTAAKNQAGKPILALSIDDLGGKRSARRNHPGAETGRSSARPRPPTNRPARRVEATPCHPRATSRSRTRLRREGNTVA